MNQRDVAISEFAVHDQKKVLWQFMKAQDYSLADQSTSLEGDLSVTST